MRISDWSSDVCSSDLETLNARGAPLTPSDLIRNFVFLRAARNQEDVDALYDTHWRGFDEKPDEAAVAKGAKFWRKEERQGRLKSSRLDLLMYHYTTLRRVETLKVAQDRKSKRPNSSH